nr:hypothetical protein [Tanacetum cinerariifolium]
YQSVTNLCRILWNDDDESSNDDDHDDDVEKSRVANAIKAIAIYDTKTNLARKSMSQTERQEEEVAENTSNKKKWGSNHDESLSQQNKGHKVPRAHTTWLINKKTYAGSLPLCNQCKSHHSGPCTVKCGNYKKVSHIIQNYRIPATAKNQQTSTCCECGSLRHYKGECPIVKFHKRMDMIHGRTENKKRLDNTSKNNQNQQQPNKRQNTGRAYTTRHGEKKHYSGSKPLCSKCNYHHDGPCAPKCHQCNRFGHLARDCRSSTNTNTTNIQKGTRGSQKYGLVGEILGRYCCNKKIVRVPSENKTLIFRSNGSNHANES